MKGFEIRNHLRNGWTLEKDRGSLFLRSPSGDRLYDSTLQRQLNRMTEGKYPVLRAVEIGMYTTRWELI